MLCMLGSYYALYLPHRGYVAFASYSQASVSDLPLPRGLFSASEPAEARRRKPFWIGRERHEGAFLVVRRIRLHYELEETCDTDQDSP